MITFHTRGRRASTILALASSALLIGAGFAQADVLKDDVSSGGGVGQHRTIAVGASTDLHYSLQAAGGCDASAGSPVTVQIQPEDGVTASPSSIQFTDCVTDLTVTFSSNTAGVYDINHSAPAGVNVNAAFWILTVGDGGDGGGDPDPCTTGSDADNDGISDACDSNSYAPVVGVQAPAANGLEGTPGNPTTAGSFTDQDGNGTLAVTKTSGAGTVTDNGDGTFSWSNITTDDASGDVTVSASDGEHAPATQTFHWVAANVAPVVGAITATPTGPCTVVASAPFSDQGTGDTHTASIIWGDTGSTNVGAVVQPGPVTGSHTYTANGTYTIGVTVTDDDGGIGTNSLSSAFATKNTAGTFLEPINAAGTRSTFKLGSTIPLKIKVTGCDGLAVTNLAPVISSIKVDSSAGDAINETTVSTATPTTGITMRWADTQYIYNFSTKNSVLSNLPSTLTAGTYTIKASDPSFYAPATATIDLKK